MKNILIIVFLIVTAITSCKNHQEKVVSDNKINVGVFNRNGGGYYTIIDALESLKIDKGINARIVSAAEIVSGAADDIDVFVFPGGSGRSEALNLGSLGREVIIRKVSEEGKGVIGICAGAYLLAKTPVYESLMLSGTEAIDVEHDHRGHGLAMFSLTEEGKKIFPEFETRDTNYMLYYEGPVLILDTNSIYKYNELATMLSDVHTVPGTPAGMTNNRPFITIAQIGEGMTASVVGHPESTPGMRWIIPRLVRVITGYEIVKYDTHIVKPDLYNKEILYTSERLTKLYELYSDLFKTKEEKLAAMQELVNMSAWTAKEWIPPMIRDEDFEVRLLAAKLTVFLERTDAIQDLEAAVKLETDPENKQSLQKQLTLLKSYLCN